MITSGWRQRLITSIDNAGRSMRSISLDAGMSHGYLRSILYQGKDPTIESLARICRELDISLAKIIYGYDLTTEEEEFIDLFSKTSPDDRRAILTLLRSLSEEG